MQRDRGFPQARPRIEGAPAVLREKYERVESTQVEVEGADTDAVVMTFSGAPDAVRLVARSFGALFTLQGIDGEENHEIVVLPNTTRMTHVSARRVLARNLVAGSNALVFVEGYWAEGREPA